MVIWAYPKGVSLFSYWRPGHLVNDFSTLFNSWGSELRLLESQCRPNFALEWVDATESKQSEPSKPDEKAVGRGAHATTASTAPWSTCSPQIFRKVALHDRHRATVEPTSSYIEPFFGQQPGSKAELKGETWLFTTKYFRNTDKKVF